MKGAGYLDMVTAAIRKDSDEAKNFRQIRSRVKRPLPEETPAPLPGDVQARTQ